MYGIVNRRKENMLEGQLLLNVIDGLMLGGRRRHCVAHSCCGKAGRQLVTGGSEERTNVIQPTTSAEPSGGWCYSEIM